MCPDTGRSANPTRPSLGSPVVDELTNIPLQLRRAHLQNVRFAQVTKALLI
jgi:hypothetical protein